MTETTNSMSADGAESSEGAESTDATADAVSLPRPRRVLIWVLIVLATVVAVLSALNVWVERQLLDTDEWVALSDKVLADDDVRGVVAAFLVDELYASVDVSAELEDRLGDDLSGLADVGATLLREPLTDAVDRLLAAPAIRGTWSDLNRTAHETLVAVLEDDVGPGLSTTEGVVTLDLKVLLEQIAQEIGLSGERISELPEDAGQVVIFESDELDTAQTLVEIVQLMSVLLFIVVVVLYAAAVYLAPGRRRKTLRNVGLSIAVGGLLILVVLRVTKPPVVEAVADTADTRGAAEAVTAIVTSLLRDSGRGGVAIGLLIALYAVLLGPSRPAVWVRRVLAPLFNARPVATWGGIAAVVLVVLYWIPGQTGDSWLRTLVILAVFAAAIEGLRRLVVDENPDATVADSWDHLRSTTKSRT